MAILNILHKTSAGSTPLVKNSKSHCYPESHVLLVTFCEEVLLLWGFALQFCHMTNTFVFKCRLQNTIMNSKEIICCKYMTTWNIIFRTELNISRQKNGSFCDSSSCTWSIISDSQNTPWSLFSFSDFQQTA